MRPIKSHIEEKCEAREENMNITRGKWLKEFLYWRQPGRMANLAQNQNQSHKTIAMAGEDVRAGVRMTVLDHRDLGQPVGVAGAQQAFRHSMGWRWTLPHFALPDSSLYRPHCTASWPSLGCSLFTSLCLWLHWCLWLEWLPSLLSPTPTREP